MTAPEREDADMLDHSRRRRIARGSGTGNQDVSQLVKGFNMVSQLTKQMSSMSMMQRMKAMMGMGNMDLEALGNAKSAPKLEGARPSKKRASYKRRKKRSR